MSQLPEPYWQDEKRGLRIYHGDCRELLPCFADGEFGSVITDPPYGVGIADWDIPPDSAILDECLRVATGTVCMFGSGQACSLQHFVGLAPERVMVWCPSWTRRMKRENGMTLEWDPVFLWRPPVRQDVIVSDRLTKHLRPSRGFRSPWWHPCMKPESLIADLIRAFGGTSVLDPYLGSGTTIAACAKLGLPGVGIELEERYCEITAARLSEDLSYGEPNLFSRTS